MELLLGACPAPAPALPCFEDKQNKDFMFTALLSLGPLGFETGRGNRAIMCRQECGTGQHTHLMSAGLQRSCLHSLGWEDSRPLVPSSPSTTKANAVAVGCGSERCSPLTKASPKLRFCPAELARPASPALQTPSTPTPPQWSLLQCSPRHRHPKTWNTRDLIDTPFLHVGKQSQRVEGIWLRLRLEPSPSDLGPRGFPPSYMQANFDRESPPHPGMGPHSQAHRHTLLSSSHGLGTG